MIIIANYVHRPNFLVKIIGIGTEVLMMLMSQKENLGNIKKWRQDVWKRDNFTCQCCGKTINDIVLNAHHIRNFSDCEELRYDVDNGITLCEECHSMFSPNGFHHIYGVKNNTREQLEEYIEQRKQHL